MVLLCFAEDHLSSFLHYTFLESGQEPDGQEPGKMIKGNLQVFRSLAKDVTLVAKMVTAEEMGQCK